MLKPRDVLREAVEIDFITYVSEIQPLSIHETPYQSSHNCLVANSLRHSQTRDSLGMFLKNFCHIIREWKLDENF